MIGTTVSHYRILEELGGGGMGVVYKAEDTKLGRLVALKFLSEELSRDSDAIQRFQREARAASSLNHPNICTIYEFDEHEGRQFIVMELMEGQTLNHRTEGKPLATEEIVALAGQITEGLEAAHTRGIIHRDIKPANLFVTDGGLVKVLDFGVAKLLPREEDATLTGTQTIGGPALGTLAYMAPEQLNREKVDARTDLYALGCVLYEMATGQRPFAQEFGAQRITSILTRMPEPPSKLNPEVPAWLDAIILKCLEKEPGRRYQSAKELQADLLRQAAPVAQAARPAAGAAGLNWLRKRRGWLASGTVVVVVGLLAAGYTFVRPRLFPPPSPTWTLKPLTSYVGLEWGANLSPDASFLAYAHNRYGHMDIFVLPTGGGDAVRLTDNPADDLTPRWSPDGRYIAFLSDRGTGTNVYLIPPLGGSERKLAETHIPWLEAAVGALFALGAVPWSPDGSELLFSRQHPTGEVAIWKVNLSTGAEVQLTQPPPGAVDSYASWSFDGKRIAFSRNQGGNASLWLLDASAARGASEPQLLLEDQYMNMTPAWSADNQQLVFVSYRSGAGNLWEIDVRSRRLRQLTTGSGAYLMPAVSPTGQLAYTTYSHQVDLYWGPVDQPQETHQRLTSHTHNNFGGRVSPDGQQVVYQSDRSGNYELWLLDRRTGAERNLTGNPAWDAMADWSPDGRELVFLSNREGSSQVWVLELDTGRVRRISEKSRPIPFEPHFSGPRWSPDGKVIGFISAGEKEEALWVVDPQGRNERAVLSGVIGFDWYRDSRHVLYTGRGADGVVEMRGADLETGKEAALLRGPAAELVVSGDGRGVAFLHSVSHLNMQLHLLRLAPPASAGQLPRALGEPQPLTRGGADWHVHNGGWSPDGKAIVYTRDADSGDVYLIENYR